MTLRPNSQLIYNFVEQMKSAVVLRWLLRHCERGISPTVREGSKPESQTEPSLTVGLVPDNTLTQHYSKRGTRILGVNHGLEARATKESLADPLPAASPFDDRNTQAAELHI